MKQIVPSLWFDGAAEEAAQLYTSLFPSSSILRVQRFGEGGRGTPGTVMSVHFVLNGQEYMAINGGPMFQFTPAVSFCVHCETQEEVDRYWDALLDGGKPTACGWLEDRYGLSWQIVPAVLFELLQDPDPAKAQRTTEAMLGMVKLDIAALKAAHAGAAA